MLWIFPSYLHTHSGFRRNVCTFTALRKCSNDVSSSSGNNIPTGAVYRSNEGVRHALIVIFIYMHMIPWPILRSLPQCTIQGGFDAFLQCVRGEGRMASFPLNDRVSGIPFVQEGHKGGHQARTSRTGKLSKAQNWKLLADVGRQLQVQQCIVVAAKRPDMVLYSKCVHCLLYWVNSLWRCDWERKKLKCAALVAETKQWGWKNQWR